MGTIPVIDVTPLRAGGDATAIAAEIDVACRDLGFFTITGHGVDEASEQRLEALAREFFALPEEEKAEIAMARGGRAWRGWFPVGGELTSGRPDRKEGIYFGQELPADDERVRAGVPLHGPNLFPSRPAGLREAVLDHMDQVTAAGHAVLRAIALALGLDPDWFDRHLTADPVVLFRIFSYPPLEPGADDHSVGEHTDYGLITLLRQDGTGGLEVKTAGGWVHVPPVPGALVVNLGDMLERMTGGRYRSTPHRVRNTHGRARVSFPLFLDPGWDALVPSAGPGRADDDPADRWDGMSVHDWSGTYGEYLLAKVGRVFPELGREVL